MMIFNFVCSIYPLLYRVGSYRGRELEGIHSKVWHAFNHCLSVKYLKCNIGVSFGIRKIICICSSSNGRTGFRN